jgi:hypothetical protein
MQAEQFGLRLSGVASPQPSGDLKKALVALNEKRDRYDNFWNYYDGNQPLVYSSSRLAQVFDRMDANFNENWCAVVVDSTIDRIQLQRLMVAEKGPDGDVKENKNATAVLNDLFENLELYLDDDDVHLAALVIGESFVLAGYDAQGEIEAYYNDPRLVHVFYKEENPHAMAMAAKWWDDAEGYRRITLYYEDRFEHYVSHARTEKMDTITEATKFVPLAENPVEPNIYGRIPIFHFRRERRGIHSELQNVIPAQDAINKLLSDMMVAAEMGAFPQRWAITNADISDLKNGPNEIWRIPPGIDGDQPSHLGEFSATQLANYIEAIDKRASYIAISRQVPKHYLFAQGGVPSGEALVAMEAPLNKKARKYIERFRATWTQLAVFLLALDGHGVEASDIQTVFEEPETIQPKTQAEIRELAIRAGLPLVTQLREEGWSDEKIDQLLQDAADESERRMANIQAQMEQTAREFDQGADASPFLGSERKAQGE